MQFDIEEFYPSISIGLLMEAINHTNSFVSMSKKRSKNHNAFSQIYLIQ